MAASQSLISSSSRPIQLRMRADLVPERQSYQGRDCWVLKDPMTLKYYRFEDEEFALLGLLDGKRNADDIQRQFESDFAPQRLSFAELYQFIGMLHRSSLLISDGAGQGDELLKRAGVAQSRRRWQSLTNVLSFRLKGIDPDRLLTRLNRYTAWFFTFPTLIFVLVIGLVAGALLLSNFEQFQDKLPSFREFFAGRNWLSLAIVLGLTKVIHEFGHGLACKRFGGQCHEMGVMFLVFTPCLYCNVSDSWMLPNKWHRIAISAAGMYVELLLASLATVVWWFSQPGMVNQLALNVMFVCSVSTLLFNANPLMKYDGYYILADWLEIPNLRQKASALLSRAMAHWFLGLTGRSDPFLPTSRQWLFCTYSLAAAIYRWLITFSIFWFLYQVLEPYGVKIVGQLLAIIAIANLIVMPMRQAYRFFSVPGRWMAVNRNRLAISSAVLGLVFLAALLIPLPHSIRCSFQIESRDSRTVFVEEPGIVAEVLARPGESVHSGQPIMRLVSLELERELVRMSGELDAAEVQLRLTQSFANSSSEIADQIPAARATYQAAVDKLQQRLEDKSKLIVRSPCDGVLLPPPRKAEHDPHDEQLGTWSGNPLEASKVGAFFESQTNLGQVVGNPDLLQATLLVDQSDIEFVSPEQPVELWFREYPNLVIAARVGGISVEPVRDVPAALSNRFGGEIVTKPDAENRESPEFPAYQVSASFKMTNAKAIQGGTGVALIQVGRRTVAQRLWRWLQKTFRFDL